MDDSEFGVIYFSLGSNLKTCDFMNNNLGRIFLRVLGKQRQKVLIKWESGCDTSTLPDNFFYYKWIPQQDVLGMLILEKTLHIYFLKYFNTYLFCI